MLVRSPHELGKEKHLLDRGDHGESLAVLQG